MDGPSFLFLGLPPTTRLLRALQRFCGSAQALKRAQLVLSGLNFGFDFWESRNRDGLGVGVHERY
jgi:hypothetical protein